MHRELIAGIRGFLENGAFVGGGMVTWGISRFAPASAGGPAELWWYPVAVFFLFFLPSLLCTWALVAKDKVEEGDRKLERRKLEEIHRVVSEMAKPPGPPAQAPVAPASVLPPAATAQAAASLAPPAPAHKETKP